jgi:hypothetical protein
MTSIIGMNSILLILLFFNIFKFTAQIQIKKTPTLCWFTGRFVARKIFLRRRKILRRIILHRKILRSIFFSPEDSSPEYFSPG